MTITNGPIYPPYECEIAETLLASADIILMEWALMSEFNGAEHKQGPSVVEGTQHRSSVRAESSESVSHL